MEGQLSVASCQSSVASCQWSRLTGGWSAPSTEIDCNSLFRNILPVTITESIFCGETRKILKTWDLRHDVSTIDQIFCEKNFNKKVFILPGRSPINLPTCEHINP